MMIKLFQRVLPYRFHMLLLSITLCGGMVASSMLIISAEITPGNIIPDVCQQGYTPQQALQWYHSMGASGRRLYTAMFLVDSINMVNYALLLGSHLFHEYSYSYSSSSARHTMTTSMIRHRLLLPTVLSYLPFVGATLDLVETLIHAHAVSLLGYPDHLPSTSTLEWASTATRAKHMCLNTSILLAVLSFVWNKYYYHWMQRQRQQQQGRSSSPIKKST